MDLFEAIRTTRSMRRLDPSQDVTESDVETILEAATRAPTGGNSQPVRWLVVRDPELKRRIAELYRQGAEVVLQRYEEQASTNPAAARMLKSSWHLADHMGEAPVLVIPCARGERGRVDSSVFPGVQNLMLAARALGLGTTLTTIHRLHEDEIKELLGIPADVHTFAVIPVGHPQGRWGEAPRRPVSEVAYRDTWGKSWPALS
jgi:nitroreductase